MNHSPYRFAASFVLLEAMDGTRHYVRVNAIQAISDCDEMRLETCAIVANRVIIIGKPLEEILEYITGENNG